MNERKKNMKLIKEIIVILLIILMLSGCQNTDSDINVLPDNENNNEVSTESTPSVTENANEEDEEIATEQTQEERKYFEAQIINNPSSGEPQNYDDLVSYLENYDNLTFISYEIVSIYSPEDAYELTELDSVLRNTTLYQVHVYYDHINDCETDYYMNLAHAGDADTQYYGYPVYEIGQKFMSAVFGSHDTWRVPVGELEFVLLTEDGEEVAYHLYNNNIVISSDSYDGLHLEMDANETTLLTSTINNPMVFTQKSSSNDLSDFIRHDWDTRGLIRESE